MMKEPLSKIIDSLVYLWFDGMVIRLEVHQRYFHGFTLVAATAAFELGSLHRFPER